MKIEVSRWSITRKKVRPSLHLGALSMLFSVSDRVGGPKLSERDRLDAVYPYRLEISLEAATLKAGAYRPSYRLGPGQHSLGDLAEGLSKKLWKVQHGRGGLSIGTDLTEYERLLWEELEAAQAEQGPLSLDFEADASVPPG